MGGKAETRVEQIESPLLKLPVLLFGRVTVSLPAFSLIFCFVTAVLFNYDEVNKTVCNVQNYIPSISAITGATPQRYVWRFCIGLHSTPRFAVGFIYYNYYMSRISRIAKSHRGLFKLLAKIAFWVYTIENSCLVGVAYIANYENYPIHEKIFVVFMFSSLFYELFTIILFKWSHPGHMNSNVQSSYNYKKFYFISILAFTAGLLYNFLRHRWYCEPGAFSIFSACEYGIAFTNIGFHYTATYELENMVWVFGMPTQQSQTGNNHKKKD